MNKNELDKIKKAAKTEGFIKLSKLLEHHFKNEGFSEPMWNQSILEDFDNLLKSIKKHKIIKTLCFFIILYLDRIRNSNYDKNRKGATDKRLPLQKN